VAVVVGLISARVERGSGIEDCVSKSERVKPVQYRARKQAAV